MLIYMYFHSQKFDISYSEECCHQINIFNFLLLLVSDDFIRNPILNALFQDFA